MSEQPKEYCEHWVVCKHAHALLYCPVDATGKHHKECEYDTRSRPHTIPPAPAVNRNKEGNLTLTYDEYSLAEHDAAIAKAAREDVLEAMFPANAIVNSNGDLKDGWELDPKPLFKLKKKMQSDPKYTEEPEAEVIEAVVLAIKESLRAQQAGEP